MTANLVREGDRLSAHLTAESIAGPRDLARLDCFRMPTERVLPRGLKSWTLEYRLGGGIAGLNRHMKLNQTGELDVAANSEELGSHIATHASGELMAKMADFLNVAQKAQLWPRGPMVDAPYTRLALISGGSPGGRATESQISNAAEPT